MFAESCKEVQRVGDCILIFKLDNCFIANHICKMGQVLAEGSSWLRDGTLLPACKFEVMPTWFL